MRHLTITSKDVAIILDCSENLARKILRDIRSELGKKRGYRVSRRQFAAYMQYELEDINTILDSRTKNILVNTKK